MAAIGHALGQVTTEDSLASTTMTTLAGATIAQGSLPAGDYLVICHAFIRGTSRTRRFECQLRHGSTVFTSSLMIIEPSASIANRGHHYAYITQVTLSGSEDLNFQRRAQVDGTSVIVDSVTIFAMRLDADLTEDTGSGGDYKFNENTTNTLLSAPDFVDFATIPLNVAASEDWLILANPTYDVESTNTNTEFRINRDSSAETAPLFSQEGENSAEQLTWLLARTYTLAAGTHTFTVQGRKDWGAQGRHLGSRIFALRLDAFEKQASQWIEASIAAEQEETMATVSVTPTTTADYLAVGYISDDSGGSLGRLWIDDEDGNADPVGSDAHNTKPYDQTDELPLWELAMPNLASGASRTINLQAQVLFGLAQHRSLTIVSMELASAAGGQLVPVEAAKLTATGVEPGFSFGGIDVAVEAASLTSIGVEPVAAPGNLSVAVEAASMTGTGVAITSSIGNLNVAVEAALATLTAPAITVDVATGAQLIDMEAAALSLSAPAIVISSTLNVAVEAASLTATGIELASIPFTIFVGAASLTATAPALALGLGNINVAVGVADLTLVAPVIIVQEAQFFIAVGTLYPINPTQYPSGATLKIYVELAQDAVSNTVQAFLQNVTDGIQVSGTGVSTTNAEKTLLISSSINLSALPQLSKNYQIFFGGTTVGSDYRWHSGKIEIVSA